MTQEIKFAREVVLSYLNKNGEPNEQCLLSIMDIQRTLADNDYSVLLEHAKAMRNILNTAIEQMESEKQ